MKTSYMAKEMVLFKATSFDMEMLAQAIASRQTVAFRIMATLPQRSRRKLSASRRLQCQRCSLAAEQYHCLQGSQLSL